MCFLYHRTLGVYHEKIYIILYIVNLWHMVSFKRCGYMYHITAGYCRWSPVCGGINTPLIKFACVVWPACRPHHLLCGSWCPAHQNGGTSKVTDKKICSDTPSKLNLPAINWGRDKETVVRGHILHHMSSRPQDMVHWRSHSCWWTWQVHSQGDEDLLMADLWKCHDLYLYNIITIIIVSHEYLGHVVPWFRVQTAVVPGFVYVWPTGICGW